MRHIPVGLLLAASVAVKGAGAADGLPAAPVPPPAAAVAASPAAPAPTSPRQKSMGRGRLRGEVAFSRREKVTGAVVALTREGDSTLLVLTASGAAGEFSADGIPEGRYRLFVFREGVRSSREEGFEVRGPFRAEADLIVQRGQGEDLPIDLQAAGSPEAKAIATAVATKEEGVGGEAAKKENAGREAANPAVAEGPDRGKLKVLLKQLGSGSVTEGRLVLRRLGGGCDPLIAPITGDDLEFPRPPAGAYSVSLATPGNLSLRLSRVVIGEGPLTIQAFLVPRPTGFPGTPDDLLPEEHPLPPPQPAAAPSSS